MSPQPAFQQFEVRDFAGGWHLVDQAAEIDSNVMLDGANVRFGYNGEVRTRGGTAMLGDVAAGGPYKTIGFAPDFDNGYVLANTSGEMRAVRVGGTLMGSATVSDGEFGFAAVGTPNASRLFFSQGAEFGYFDGTTMVVAPPSTVEEVAGAAPRPRAMAVTTWDNRLMACGFNATEHGPAYQLGSPSTIFFSEAGDPLKWDLQWRETLMPGDGERIVAAVAWRNMVFVFKQSKFFVFTGTSSDGQGNPLFDYYAVQAGCGASSVMGVCAARDGVYFVDRKGIYRTKGQEPELVSWPLEPLFTGVQPPFSSTADLDSGALDHASIFGAAERIHVCLPVSGGNASWCYDPRYDWWVPDTIPMRSGVEVWRGGQAEAVFLRYGSDRLWRHREGIYGDDGEWFDSFWRGTWRSFSGVGEKTLRRMRVWGYGLVRVEQAVDYRDPEFGGQLDMTYLTDYWGDGTDPEDPWGDGEMPEETWGTGPRFCDDWVNWDWRGELFSPVFRSVGGLPWSVQRVENHVSVPRRAATDVRANVAVGDGAS